MGCSSLNESKQGIIGALQSSIAIMFRTCQERHPSFKVGTTLKGIVMDWSDSEVKGLREVVRDEISEIVLRGSNVHWSR